MPDDNPEGDEFIPLPRDESPMAEDAPDKITVPSATSAKSAVSDDNHGSGNRISKTATPVHDPSTRGDEGDDEDESTHDVQLHPEVPTMLARYSPRDDAFVFQKFHEDGSKTWPAFISIQRKVIRDFIEFDESLRSGAAWSYNHVPAGYEDLAKSFNHYVPPRIAAFTLAQPHRVGAGLSPHVTGPSPRTIMVTPEVRRASAIHKKARARDTIRNTPSTSRDSRGSRSTSAPPSKPSTPYSRPSSRSTSDAGYFDDEQYTQRVAQRALASLADDAMRRDYLRREAIKERKEKRRAREDRDA
ncbi:hypothetical protein PUNSTDRAFT_48179 [Punctularia strigosozonata HHB-11173 SS5]|uniref:Uncharacterized protein n=1 Tax=Punctularia strigosozonata (strain HHB-11173) TaxID=741275 RepID=R7S088_PUNST|nr:uncharacterized protein PUNSTDRAFT_48179 [Punctularia strigosozonata HHB-11173 SS5]EIN03229.1 hypothetical protein PUNSTDRAFT_48179 [Punctularia strigosozonata HHB-11173 SS5]